MKNKLFYKIFIGVAAALLILLVSLVLIVRFFGFGAGFSGNHFDDVSTNQKYWGGYVLGQDYQLTAPVFMCGNGMTGSSENDNSFLMGPTSLCPQQAGDPVMPATVDQYRASPQKWPQITSVLPAGTRIRVAHFQVWVSFEYTQLSVSADVVTGGLQPKDVTINGLSRPAKADSYDWEPNPAVLEPVPK